MSDTPIKSEDTSDHPEHADDILAQAEAVIKVEEQTRAKNCVAVVSKVLDMFNCRMGATVVVHNGALASYKINIDAKEGRVKSKQKEKIQQLRQLLELD